MARERGEQRPQGRGRPKRAVGVYERPERRSRAPWAILIAVLVILILAAVMLM